MLAFFTYPKGKSLPALVVVFRDLSFGIGEFRECPFALDRLSHFHARSRSGPFQSLPSWSSFTQVLSFDALGMCNGTGGTKTIVTVHVILDLYFSSFIPFLIELRPNEFGFDTRT